MMDRVSPTILRRKIAATESRRAEQMLPVEQMSAAIASVLENYFMLKLTPPALFARVIEPQKLASKSAQRAWYLFRSGEADIVVSFDFSLTIAATNMAIGRKFSEVEEAKPSLADRAIAAGLAQRSAAAISIVKELPDSAPAFVRSSWDFDEIKIDRDGLRFEWYEANGISLTESFQATLAFGVSIDAAHSSQSAMTSDSFWAEQLLDIAIEADIRLDANLGLINTSFESLLDIAPGSMLTVSVFNRDDIPMTVRGSQTRILSGKIGGKNGFKAVRIQSPTFG